MCLAALAVLAEAWDDGPSRTGRLEDGCTVTLAFVPDAQPGDGLLLHLGIPVEILDPATDLEARALRGEGGATP